MAITSSAYADQLYVLNESSGNVSVIDTPSNQATALISIGSGPEAIEIAPYTSGPYVAKRNDNTIDYSHVFAVPSDCPSEEIRYQLLLTIRSPHFERGFGDRYWGA